MIIKIPNKSLFIEGKDKLSPDELIVFALLFKFHNLDYHIVTSIDLLNQIFKFKNGNDRKNKSVLREIIVSLELKQYINTNISAVMHYDELISGTIVNVEDNYSGIDSSILDELLRDELNKAKLKFYIYADINRYKNGNALSYSTISSKCTYFNSNKKHSVTVIQDIINEMDGKLIYRFRGEKETGSNKQEVNKYLGYKYMTDRLIKLYKSQNEHKKEKKKRRGDKEFIRWNALCGDGLTVKELKGKLRESNWGKKDRISGLYNQLEFVDYYFYRLAKDEGVSETFVKSCDDKIDKMRDNPSCMYDFDAWEVEYLDSL